MRFVLHCLEELLGDGCARVIVYAEGVNLQHLAIEHFPRTANVSDSSQQLVEIIPLSCVFEQVIIKYEAFNHVLFKHLSSPIGGTERPDAS